MKWERKLTRTLRTTNGTELRTIKEAAQFASDPKMVRRSLQELPRWQDAARLLMAAARGGSVKAATEAVETALRVDRQLT